VIIAGQPRSGLIHALSICDFQQAMFNRRLTALHGTPGRQSLQFESNAVRHVLSGTLLTKCAMFAA
jgi:hypothetical protein